LAPSPSARFLTRFRRAKPPQPTPFCFSVPNPTTSFSQCAILDSPHVNLTIHKSPFSFPQLSGSQMPKDPLVLLRPGCSDSPPPPHAFFFPKFLFGFGTYGVLLVHPVSVRRGSFDSVFGRRFMVGTIPRALVPSFFSPPRFPRTFGLCPAEPPPPLLSFNVHYLAPVFFFSPILVTRRAPLDDPPC